MFALPANEHFVIDRAATLQLRLEKSLGMGICQNLMMRGSSSGQLHDVYGNGDRSCAMYVATMLWGVGLLTKPKASVDSLVDELLEHGWEKTNRAAAFMVVVWGVKQGNDGFPYRHAGICQNRINAYCNDPVSGVPILTPIKALRLHSGEPRPVECFYTHPLLAA